MKVKDLREVMDDCWFILVDCEDEILWDEKEDGAIPRNLLKKKVKVAVAFEDEKHETCIGVEI